MVQYTKLIVYIGFKAFAPYILYMQVLLLGRILEMIDDDDVD